MATQTTPQLHRISTSAVNVRKGPSLAYERVTSIADDASYPILGKYHTGQSGDIGTWWQVERPDPDIDSKWGDNIDSGWVRGDNVVTEGDVSGVCVTWQPYTATLRTGSLALPFKDTLAKPNVEIPPIAITNLFDDFRTRHLYEGLGDTHNGIDWAMRNHDVMRNADKVTHPIYAMAAGRVTAIVDETQGGALGTYVTVQSDDGFRITYAHLEEVEQGLVNKFNNKETADPRVHQGQRLGLPGTTGNSTGVHLHAQLKPDYTEEIPANHKHVDGAVNFQQYLPAGIYHWPDIAALEAAIKDASESVRPGLVDAIKQWMDNALRGGIDPNKPRLRVKAARKVYMLPRVDEEFAYPCRPFPGSTIVGKDQAVWALSHSLLYEDAPPTPAWWRIQINPSFPACWVRNEDAVVIGNLREVPLASPSLSADLPRFLRPKGVKVRERPKKYNRNSEGKLVEVDNVIVTFNIDGWVPIVDLSCDETTGDYLWYKIPYNTANRAARGWVRGDMVDVKCDLSDEDIQVFPNDANNPENDICPKVQKPADTTPQASTEPGQTVEAHIFPDRGSPAPRGFAGTTRIRGIFKGITPSNPYTWYQLQIANARRGWVRDDRVTVRHTDGLSAVQPQLRLWSGHTGGVPVYGGCSPYEKVLATIAAGSTAWHRLLGRDAAQPGWWHIRFSNTITGWVRADDAVETEGNLNLAPPPQVGLANPAQACVVRSQPTATATQVAMIEAGSTKLHPVLERDANPAAWYRIRFGDIVGWVSAACVRLHGDGRNLPVRPQASLKPTVTNGVKVRVGPGLEHAWIGSIPGGSTVRYDILGQDAATPVWWQIRFSDTVVGWVHKDNMLTHGSLENLTVTWLPQLSPRADAKAGLNVHAGPGAHHRVLVTLPVDATRYYDILGRDAAATAWYQIRVGALLIGWVPREYVQTRGPLANLPVTWTPDPQVDTDPAAESGTSLNQAEHHNGTYTLNFDGSTVTAGFSSSSSPVQYYARADQGRAPVFRILDPDLRPTEKVVLSTDTAQEVNRDGSTKTGGMPRTLKLEVHTDGNVYYADEGLRRIGYLDYNITGTWTPAAAVPRERGASLNQTEHHDGAYTLTVRDDTVHAAFTSSSSPVQYFARADQGRAPVFRIADAALRPAAGTTLTVTDAREVNRDGTPKTGGVDRTFKLEVHTDGNVHYVDEGVRDIGYLSYRATGSWPLAPVETQVPTVPRPPATRPVLESGASLNQTEHRDGAYTLTRGRASIAAAFASSSSPVQYFARADQGRAPVFRIAAPALRPAAKVVLSTNTAQEVNRDGTPKTGGTTRTLKLEVQPNGEVHYVDEGLRQVGYLSYSITGGWPPTAAADTADDDTDTGTPSTKTPTPRPQPAPAPVTARPTRERGTSLNQTEHRSGAYTLNRSGNNLTAAFAAASSPVQYFARADQGRAPIFRIAAPALRPQAKVVLTTTEAREVDRDGNPRPGAADRTLKLEVHTNGNVHYADEGLRNIGYLKYRVTGSWTLAAPDPATPQLSLKASATYNLNVRSGPGTAHGKVGFLRGGSATRYHILGKNAATAAWYQIRFSPTVTGWVHRDHVQTHGDLSGLTVTWTPPRLSLKTSTTYNLNVRSGPGTIHDKVGLIPGGSATRYDILGKDAATPVWWQIWFSDTVIGWVHGNYVQTHGDVSDVPVR